MRRICNRRGPVARDEAAHQILDHAREGEEPLVDLVMHEASVAGSRAEEVRPQPRHS